MKWVLEGPGNSEHDYGPEIEASNVAYRSDRSVQEALVYFMDEFEGERRKLAYMKVQQDSKRHEVFVNFGLSEAILPDGSVVIDSNAANERASTAFRPIRVRR